MTDILNFCEFKKSKNKWSKFIYNNFDNELELDFKSLYIHLVKDDAIKWFTEKFGTEHINNYDIIEVDFPDINDGSVIIQKRDIEYL